MEMPEDRQFACDGKEGQMIDRRYSDLASRSSHSAAVMARGEDFFLAHLVDGHIQEVDLYAATLKGFHLKGLVALIDGEVIAKFEPENLVLACHATEHFTQGLKSLPTDELARLELERLALLEDPR